MNGCIHQRSVFSVLLLVLLILGGCGYKNAPVPPRNVLPVAIHDLRADLDEKGATLSWTFPKKTMVGDSVEEISEFQLYRAEEPVDGYCPTCPVPYAAWMTVPGGLLASDEDRTATCEVRGLRPGYLYFFKVRSKAGLWIESQDSNEVSFFWQTPPAAPAGVSAASGDGRNTVQWQPVGTGATGAEAGVLRYQVYRAVGAAAAAKVGEPVAAPPYTDTAVENGMVYTYQVQTIATYPRGSVYSGLSATAEARPLDQTAPSAPGRVEGLRTDVGVKIFWDHAAGKDLAGYRVYRRTAGEGKATLVGEVELPYNMFIDVKAPGTTLFYSVSSIDTRTPANESSRSAEIRIDN
ncbi:hypothetical protein [Desulfobulbus sp.]|uniref:fibronectin type III domain-containing protein n=1 Tax=Desulfobulbus sp. TaxID=895 RepID=UPI00286FADF6|nr:hypothetical protein [Desulfobulbus sp.]